MRRRQAVAPVILKQPGSHWSAMMPVVLWICFRGWSPLSLGPAFATVETAAYNDGVNDVRFK